VGRPHEVWGGVCSWGCPGGLGFAPVRARCGRGAAACVAGFLAAPGTQGSWWLGQQEIQCSRRLWQPVLANKLWYSCLENPRRQRRLQATVHRVAKNWKWLKRPCMHRHKIFFFFFLPVAALPQWGLSVKFFLNHIFSFCYKPLPLAFLWNFPFFFFFLIKKIF